MQLGVAINHYKAEELQYVPKIFQPGVHSNAGNPREVWTVSSVRYTPDTGMLLYYIVQCLREGFDTGASRPLCIVLPVIPIIKYISGVGHAVNSTATHKQPMPKASSSTTPTIVAIVHRPDREHDVNSFVQSWTTHLKTSK